MEDTAVYKVIAGRMPFWPERERWQQIMSGQRFPVMAAVIVLVLFFALNACGGTETLVGWSLLLVIGAAVLGGGWLLLFPIFYRHRRADQLKTRWYDEQADRRRFSAGYTVEICGDRVVYTDLRSRTVIPYTAVTACFETADGILLTADAARILVRSYDLTVADHQWLRQWLYSRLSEEVVCVKREAVPQLAQPLPILGFCNEDTVISRGVLCAVAPQTRQRFRLVAGTLVLPTALVISALIATVATMGNTFLDLILLFGAIAASALILLLLLVIPQAKTVVAQVALTQDGLAWHCGRSSDFVVWERIRVGMRPDGLRLWFFDGTSVFLPFKNLENPDAVRRFFIKKQTL